MSTAAWITFSICTGWIGFAYFFLFVRKGKNINTSNRVDTDVITFYSGTAAMKSSGDLLEPVAPAKSNKFSPSVTTSVSTDVNTPHDDDLVDLTTLSLNLSTNNNPNEPNQTH